MISKQMRQTITKYVKTVVIRWKHTKGMKKKSKRKIRVRNTGQDSEYKPPNSKQEANKNQQKRRSKRSKKTPDNERSA